MNTLRERTRIFASRVIGLYTALPRRSPVSRVIGNQLLRSGTSPGAQCREGHRSRSDAEIISKYETALQELDESLYWMELIVDAKLLTAARLAPLMQEATELIAILVTSVRTIKRRNGR